LLGLLHRCVLIQLLLGAESKQLALKVTALLKRELWIYTHDCRVCKLVVFSERLRHKADWQTLGMLKLTIQRLRFGGLSLIDVDLVD